ncbi:Signal transduction histidine kinase [Micromonospora pattaloongensis]|uniref:histidine kinase n=1 Tax=Micromonospora pattaloongensis TaxID=405436 RepID=A0A1H3NRQ3_9ACTN|nr:nitrate- and nitrite sensing domain-containing protein [Micromonospora pattaloongensis]SDY91468.1 Signal transduction histidine kinase [Micromonospora pattaloongensis]
MPRHRSASTVPTARDTPTVPDSAAAREGGTIRRRLLGILALPALAVLLLLGYVTAVEVSDYRTSTETSRAVELALSVQDLVQELQTERGLTAGLLGGNVGFRDEIPPARRQVDAERAEVERRIADGGELEERVGRALRELDGLPAIRSAADSGGAGRAAAFQFFTERIATLNGVDFGLGEAGDAALRRHVAVLGALGRLKESTAQERAFLNGVFSAGGFAKGEFLQFAAMRAAKESALADFAQHATQRQKAANAYVLDTGAAREAAYFEQVALSAANGRHLQVNPQSWWSALTTVLDDMRQMQQYVGSEIQVRADVRQVDAARRLGVLAGVVALCLAGAVVLLVVASRSITGPLAALAAEADGLASHRLPEAVGRVQSGDGDEVPPPPPPVRVPVRATTEVRSVADALDRVQAVAYRLATEQALLRRSTTESLANLGRRNQNLLRRQLGFITTLEREEADPTGLANLFELDHLATRMRRNAESLLVLVGAASPRQWSAPLPIADVVRAAVSEVEEYRRVSLRRIDDAYVAGTVVSGLAHMLAELIENGLNFSPPDSDVEIQGRRTGDGYLIAITDQGVGMDADDLARANERLRGEADFVSSPTRYLGHYVVGQLSRQLGVDVQLAPSPVTGITARVTLPAAVMAAPAPLARAEVVTATPAEPAMVVASVPHAAVAQPAPAAPPTPSKAIGARPAPVVEYLTESGAPMPTTAATAPTAAMPVVESRGPAGPASNGGHPLRTAAGGHPLRTAAGGHPLPTAAGGPPLPGAAGAGAAPEGERTANGLRKRIPRSRRPQPAAPDAPTHQPAPRTGRSGTLDDSPAEVRARLTALRAGMLRGQTQRPPDGGQPGADGRRHRGLEESQ